MNSSGGRGERSPLVVDAVIHQENVSSQNSNSRLKGTPILDIFMKSKSVNTLAVKCEECLLGSGGSVRENLGRKRASR